MIWRQTYESAVSYDEAIPVVRFQTLSGEPFSRVHLSVLLVSKGFDGLVEQNVWWKLHEEDFPKCQSVYRAFANLTINQIAEAESMVAPSQRQRTLLLSGELDGWFNPDNPAQAFAGILKEDSILMAVRGLPTEDCWEEFSNKLRSELDGPRSSHNL